MNKQQFIDTIKALPDDITFLLSSDDEGTSYREARLSSSIEYAEGDGYEWSVYGSEEDAKECLSEDLEDGEEPDLSTLTKVAVFW